MTRQIMTMNNVKKVHVVADGDNAGWFNYESGVAYEPGTLVMDSNNVFWCSIVPIADTDTDAPLDAPDKWAWVPFININ